MEPLKSVRSISTAAATRWARKNKESKKMKREGEKETELAKMREKKKRQTIQN